MRGKLRWWGPKRYQDKSAEKQGQGGGGGGGGEERSEGGVGGGGGQVIKSKLLRIS